MAGVVCSVTLALTVTRAVLVVDAVSPRARRASSGAFARAARAINSKRSEVVSQRGPLSSRSPRGPAGVGASRMSPLHKRLLAMHLIAVIGMSTAVAKYTLPMSESSCRVSQGFIIGTILLYDACLVLFLLAKTRVTNGNRRLAKWEIAITWWSRFYAWVYLPACAIALPFLVPIAVDEEGTYCVTGPQAEGEITEVADTLGFASNNAMLIIQFFLLLAMFVKPMLVPQGGTQSGGAIYRRVVLRNVVCTAGIAVAYIVTTLVIVLAMLAQSAGSNKEDQIIDATAPINMLATLTLTEIALPLGFSSCVKSIRGDGKSASKIQQRQTGEQLLTTKPSTKPVAKPSAKPGTNPHVVPLDGSVSDPV